MSDLFEEEPVDIEIEDDGEHPILRDESPEEAAKIVSGQEVQATEVMLAHEAGGLLELAVSRDLDTDKLQALIDMNVAERERQAKRQYDLHFAEMQAAFTSVKRGKDGYNYKYAPIEVLQAGYGPVIADHKFSYRWRETPLDNGDLRVTLIISGYGHSEENSFDVPPLEENPQMNAVQNKGARQTYGRRYTFIPGFGVIIEDEDTDAQTLTFEAGVKYADYLNAIDAENDIAALREMVQKYRIDFGKQGDHDGQDVVLAAYNKRKETLKNAQAGE